MTSTVFSISRSCLYWHDSKYFVITVVPIAELLERCRVLRSSSLTSNFGNDSNSHHLSLWPCGFQKYRPFFLILRRCSPASIYSSVDIWYSGCVKINCTEEFQAHRRKLSDVAAAVNAIE